MTPADGTLADGTLAGGSVRIGVDVGGTFTDLVALDETTGEVVYHKTPSSPADPSVAIARAIEALFAAGERRPDQVCYLGHGTTVATNMVIERSGARTALITTRGFRDVLEIARQTRPDLYDYRQVRPEPLAPRRYRFEVSERLSAAGKVLVPLDEKDVHAVIERLQAQRVEAVAIVLLHAYRNSSHEQRIEAMVRERLPDLFVCRSSEVLPEFREFERASTTAMNAFLGPRMRAYMGHLRDRVANTGITVAPHTVQSNGGLMSVDAVSRLPVRTCLSGPAAGVVAAAAIGRAAGEPNLIGFDVGGTSTDVSLIIDGTPATTQQRLVAGYPVRSPMIDVHVIGAGGGSIARVDEAGALKVGPHSAGADPGPVAYGRGGQLVTLTDANVVLGRLNPNGLLGGTMSVAAGKARAALKAQIADPLGLGVEAAALGIIAVAVANIARAIRSVSTERGHDPGGLALLACGGAGPLHAVEVAKEVECHRVIVPVEPGTLCARGILLSDLRTDLVRSVLQPATPATWEQVRAGYRDLHIQATQWLETERVKPADTAFKTIIDARYKGQSFEIPVELDDLAATNAHRFRTAFHQAHAGIYGYEIADREVIIVNCRLEVWGAVAKAPLQPAGPTGGSDGGTAGAENHHRAVCVGAPARIVEIPVFARNRLSTGAIVTGPAVIEEMSSTTYISASDRLEVDRFGNLLIDIGEPHA